MSKSELRKIYFEKRYSLSAEEISALSTKISNLFFKTFQLEAIKTLHCFLSITKYKEIDTSMIYEQVWKEFPEVRTVSSRINFETGEMNNFAFSAVTMHVENRWGIREPVSSENVEADEIDVVLVPMLISDLHGHRVGYGKGFYDKLLADCRPDCLKIGLNYFAPVPSIIGTGSHDIKVDFCLTPDSVYSFNN